MKFSFKGVDGYLEPRIYKNGRKALVFVDMSGRIILPCSVNLPNEPLDEDEILIKNYSENQGMLDALVDAGVVRFDGVCVDTGYINLSKCKLIW